ncbi:energy transducer TonB [Edaphobacter bradus]|uniref:energy transducer TonB n=1 Tax=Edaphobacter bradus TaxID=2259016 RepID=UPI0021E09FEF|nr:TonB family protein [Edaphobacter bradus]
MAKPLRSDDPAPPSMQFTHFGVLNDGNQSKGSLFTSVTVNIVIAVVVCILGAAAKKTMDKRNKLTSLVEPIPIKKVEPEPVRPKIIPKPLPTPPVVKVEPPKIKMPEIKLPDPPKIQEVKMQQAPVVLPAPPKLVQPPPAPKVVNLAQAMPASVPNNSPHPSAVALGQANNPIAPSNRPAASAINLGQRGLAGMPASNTGAGAHATAVNLGSGSPGSQNMNGHDNAANAVKGVKLGVAGGTGPLNAPGRVAGPVNLGQNTPPPMPKPTAPTQTARSAPKVLFKPKPEYTAEALKLHIEGTVSVRLRVSSSGAVQVLGVISDLGHGLGESAVRAVQATRFQPATDASGQPVDWEGVVNVAFQLAG